MQERSGIITLNGSPLTLLGPELKAGYRAPNFTVCDNGLKPISLADYKGKIKIISALPSLDTPVCDMETRRFNQEAANLDGNVMVLTISMDLPFAQGRWCAAAGIDRVVTLSDYKERAFGIAYGVLIKEIMLLARAVFVVDSDDVIRYVQVVPEIAAEPDYKGVLDVVRQLK